MGHVMGKSGLLKLIGNAQTLKEAFSNLKGERMIAFNNVAEDFAVVESRDEFAVIKDWKSENHYLHPYGTKVGYNVMEKVKD
jgi:hypothetical protein